MPRKTRKLKKSLYCDGSRMDDGYVGAGLALEAPENERNWEGFNGESYQLRDNKKVYNAELFGIAMSIRHANVGTYLKRIWRKGSDRYWYCNQARQTRGYLLGSRIKWKAKYGSLIRAGTEKLNESEGAEEEVKGLRSFYDRRVRNADHRVFEQDWDWEEYRDG
jgi:hypothetical protein